ncbi:MAG: hypothetical protein SGPRY_013963, partial [Prymnesium sp.]
SSSDPAPAPVKLIRALRFTGQLGEIGGWRVGCLLLLSLLRAEEDCVRPFGFSPERPATRGGSLSCTRLKEALLVL